MRWCSGPFKRQDPLGYHAPLAIGDAHGCLQQRDALRTELPPLNFNEVVEPVERRGETVNEHDKEVASPPSLLTDPSS